MSRDLASEVSRARSWPRVRQWSLFATQRACKRTHHHSGAFVYLEGAKYDLRTSMPDIRNAANYLEVNSRIGLCYSS